MTDYHCYSPPIISRPSPPHLSLPEGSATQYSMVNCAKIGGRSSAIRVGSRLEGLADNAQGRSSSCPGGLPGLEEDSYLKLRSGFLREFKSMSALFQRCQPAPEVGLGRAPGRRTASQLNPFFITFYTKQPAQRDQLNLKEKSDCRCKH